MKNSATIRLYHKKAQRWAKILGKFPGVRAIFLSGSLARGDGNKNSDIDLFIITKARQIWTARFWVVVCLKLFGQLAKPHNHAGKICPNHFISENSLEIQEQDRYAAELFSTNVPLYDPQNIFAQFIHKNEKWVVEFGCSFREKVDSRWSPPSTLIGGGNEVGIKKLKWWQKSQEFFLKSLQIWKIKRNPDYQIPGACIVLDDTELRFHPVPKNRSRRK